MSLPYQQTYTEHIKKIFSQRLMSVFNDRDDVDDDKNMTRKNSNIFYDVTYTRELIAVTFEPIEYSIIND